MKYSNFELLTILWTNFLNLFFGLKNPKVLPLIGLAFFFANFFFLFEGVAGVVGVIGIDFDESLLLVKNDNPKIDFSVFVLSN